MPAPEPTATSPCGTTSPGEVRTVLRRGPLRGQLPLGAPASATRLPWPFLSARPLSLTFLDTAPSSAQTPKGRGVRGVGAVKREAIRGRRRPKAPAATRPETAAAAIAVAPTSGRASLLERASRVPSARTGGSESRVGRPVRGLVERARRAPVPFPRPRACVRPPAQAARRGTFPSTAACAPRAATVPGTRSGTARGPARIFPPSSLRLPSLLAGPGKLRRPTEQPSKATTGRPPVPAMVPRRGAFLLPPRVLPLQPFAIPGFPRPIAASFRQKACAACGPFARAIQTRAGCGASCRFVQNPDAVRPCFSHQT